MWTQNLSKINTVTLVWNMKEESTALTPSVVIPTRSPSFLVCRSCDVSLECCCRCSKSLYNIKTFGLTHLSFQKPWHSGFIKVPYGLWTYIFVSLFVVHLCSQYYRLISRVTFNEFPCYTGKNGRTSLDHRGRCPSYQNLIKVLKPLTQTILSGYDLKSEKQGVIRHS